MRTTLHPNLISGFALRALLILLLVFTGTEASSAWQLCLGTEGHVEIERRGACEDAEHLPSTDTDADECDPCHDILLDVDSDEAFRVDRPSERPQVVEDVSATARATTTADPTTILYRSPFSADIRFPAGPPAGIRTVVLLI